MFFSPQFFSLCNNILTKDIQGLVTRPGDMLHLNVLTLSMDVSV